MIIARTLLAGATALALLALPITAAAQAGLPAELSALGLSKVRDETDGDGERNIRGFLPDGYRFEAEYRADGRVEDLKTERASELPRALLESILPGDVVEAIFGRGMMERVHEIEFDGDDGEIEVEGHGAESRIEATFSTAGQMLEFERERAGPRGRPGRGLAPGEVQARAEQAGYTDIGSVRFRKDRASFDAVNPHGEPVTVSMDGKGEIRREAAR